MAAEIRKIVLTIEEIQREAGQILAAPTRKAVAAAVIANPFAGVFVEDLAPLIAIGAELGGALATRCREALAVPPERIESYGKAAMVGEAGELEHAAALLHPSLGAPMRAAAGGGAALIPSAKKMGGPGQSLDIPLGHKDAAFVRSHFDAVEIRLPDAPRAGELLLAIALTDSGRPLPRIGGLTVDKIIGEDGLR
ncbi:MAG: amino acid synthesis family protein [Pseudomonadota bacterium]